MQTSVEMYSLSQNDYRHPRVPALILLLVDCRISFGDRRISFQFNVYKSFLKNNFKTKAKFE